MFLPVPSADSSKHLSALDLRVSRLENALSRTLEVLHSLLQKLENRLGPDFVGEEIGPLLQFAGSQAHDAVARIDALIRQGKQPEATRLFREVTGITWDQAHDVIERWGAYSPAEKERWLQLHRWVQALDQSSVSLNRQNLPGSAFPGRTLGRGQGT